MSGMGPDVDCPECGNYRIRPGVKMCAVCETCARYEKKIAELEKKIADLEDEIENLETERRNEQETNRD